MKNNLTSTPTNDPHVTLELLDQTPDKPSGKNRSRAEQRHHRERVKNNRTNQIRESEPGVDLEDFNQRWLSGLDDHNVANQSRHVKKHEAASHKYSTKGRREPIFDDYDYPDDTGDYYNGSDY